MLPKETVRGFQIDQLRKGLKIVHSLISTTTSEDVTTYRDGGTGWTVLEVLAHLCDYEGEYYHRARMTVEQDMPDFQVPDQDAWVMERRYNEQDIHAIYQKWVDQRTEFLNFLTGLDESAWQRAGRHPKRGVMSLADQLALVSWHDVNHIEQMTHILAERR
jgi:uncharacterized damage-inducible protein DinB